METIKSMVLDADINTALKLVAENMNEKTAIKMIVEMSDYDQNAAQLFLDHIVLGKKSYTHAIIDGHNKTVNGNTRYWVNVKATKLTKRNKKGQLMVFVVDPQENYDCRWLTLSTFSGTIVHDDSTIETWVNGKMVNETKEVGTYRNSEIAHNHALVKEYFQMDYKQWEIFLKGTTTQSMVELINLCKKERS